MMPRKTEIRAMIPTMLAAPAIVRAEEHIDDYAGHYGKDREGREPDDGDQSERLGESLAGADARAALAETSRGKATVTSAPGRNRAIWPAIAAAA